MGPLIGRRSVLLGAAAVGGCVIVSPPDGVIISTAAVWPDDPPGSPDIMPAEDMVERSSDPSRPDRAIVHVRWPRLTVFRPARPDGSAVLVIPGGGYQRVVIDKEGDETAMFLARHGVTAAVLTYRLPADGWAAGWEAPVQDGQRAMRLLRAGRLAPGIDPQRVGVLGFSAGGHLAATLTLSGEAATYAPADAVDAVSPAPDFAALIYAAYLNGEGSPALGLGEAGPAPDLIARVDANTPPVFLVHAADDRSVPVEGSQRMFAALQAAGVRAELHVFPDGGHGFGIAGAKGKAAASWPDLFLAWFRSVRGE